MGTGFRGTFAIAWSDSEVDGVEDAPVDALAIGASWCWYGRAVRIDGPQDVLILDEPEGAADLRARAARSIGRMTGIGHLAQNRDDGRLDPDGPLRDGFSVTDGRRQYAVAMLRDPRTGRMLLAFPGSLPAPGTEHWITAITGRPRRAAASGPQGVICFTEGTLLRTPDGERPVETLQAGDRVLTRDDGAQEVLWVGNRHFTGARLLVAPDLRPIRIRARALDGDLPDADLLVSPQHRVLIRGRSARALFNTDEVLVAAADLINDRTITVARALRSLTYYHLMLPRHQVVWANGVATESFHPAEMPLERIEAGQRERLYRIFPDLARDPARYGAPARRMLSRAEAAILRHDMRPLC
jgi:hypothetical protein